MKKIEFYSKVLVVIALAVVFAGVPMISRADEAVVDASVNETDVVVTTPAVPDATAANPMVDAIVPIAPGVPTFAAGPVHDHDGETPMDPIIPANPGVPSTTINPTVDPIGPIIPTTFATATPSVAANPTLDIDPTSPTSPTTPTRRHSSSGGSVSSLLSTVGQVLGATDFQFLTDLSVGMNMSDVAELQARLRAEGFFTFATNTGFFGPITLDAVKQYQSAHGVNPTGFVGPITRGVLNAN